LRVAELENAFCNQDKLLGKVFRENKKLNLELKNALCDSDSDVSDDSSPENLSLRVAKLENALCNQDKLLGKVFRENKKLNFELESAFLKLFLFDPRTMI
jgi:hypothetical protein